MEKDDIAYAIMNYSACNSAEIALKEAIASAEMEGFSFSEEEVEIAQRIMDGEMTLEEYFVKILID